jgi:putative transposase
MSHIYTQNLIHLVFSTKERCRSISTEFQPRLWAYAASVCRNHEIGVHASGGFDDHLHLLIELPPTLPLAKAANIVKANTSRWAHEQGRRVFWQEGYAAFSVSLSVSQTVIRYIQNQPTHHRKMDFRTEFLLLLKKHHVPFDPKFVLG